MAAAAAAERRWMSTAAQPWCCVMMSMHARGARMRALRVACLQQLAAVPVAPLVRQMPCCNKARLGTATRNGGTSGGEGGVAEGGSTETARSGKGVAIRRPAERDGVPAAEGGCSPPWGVGLRVLTLNPKPGPRHAAGQQVRALGVVAGRWVVPSRQRPCLCVSGGGGGGWSPLSVCTIAPKRARASTPIDY